jgi:hypothetical protein
LTQRTSTLSYSVRQPLGGCFDAIDAELDPGLCDKLPLIGIIEAYAQQAMAR